MAVPLAYRLAIWIGGGSIAVRSVSGAHGNMPWEAVVERFYDRLTVDQEEMDALSEEMSLYAGYAFSLATYSEPFELRKVQFIWSMQDAAVASEDARVVTFHLAKISGGTVSSDWLAADFTALDAAYTTWWGAIKALYPNELVWDRIKVYKAGPAIVPPQPPVYDADKSVAGTDASNTPLPPQVAVSVTEIAGTKRHWGRFYLPGGTGTSVSAYGRVIGTTQNTIADATDVLYTALKTAGLEPVVYRPPLPERETKSGATLPARGGSAWTVEKVQVDDVFDVIRRRRYKYPTLRVQRDI